MSAAKIWKRAAWLKRAEQCADQGSCGDAAPDSAADIS